MKSAGYALLTVLAISVSGLTGLAYAADGTDALGGGSAKLIGAGLAFGLAALGAGVG